MFHPITAISLQFFTFDFTLPAIQMMEKVIFFRVILILALMFVKIEMLIQVHHARKFIGTLSDSKPIGIFRIDVATVFNEQGHAFERKWAQLINPQSVESPCGHLLVSIAVSQQGVPTKVKSLLCTKGNDG